MKRIRIAGLTGFLFLAVVAAGQVVRISPDEIRGYVEFLASDSLKGRKPGTPEINVAAGYILDHFREAGLRPMAENGYQWFEIVTEVMLGDDNGLVFGNEAGIIGKDYTPLAFSGSGAVEAKVVFAGYGFAIDADSLKWNDYAGIDPRGKWVMIFRADPEPDNSESKFIPYGDIRAKVLTAKDKGAAGVLLVTPKTMEKEDKLMTLVAENNDVTAGLPVIHITRELAGRIIKVSGIAIDSLNGQIISSKAPKSFELEVILSATVTVVQRRERTANVLAMLEGSDPSLAGEYLVVGAHYDHLGLGGPGSGSRMPDTTAIHNGADDNASGTAMVMALARAMAIEGNRPRRSMIFAAFSAEEIGLLGSKYFNSNPPVELKKIDAMFNFDMVGRFDKEKNAISVSGTGTSGEADSLLRSLEEGLPFSVIHSPDGYGPSDHAAFYSSNIPVFYFNTGVHTDYHTPFDDAGLLDYKTSAEVGDFAASVIMAVDKMPRLTFREAGRKDQSGRTGRRLKVTLGIMPDFAGTEKKGLRIDGVTKDGPADKGGMKKGDIITGINGQPVGNIYEYMSRLQKLKHGMTVNVEVIRDGRNEVLLIQL